MAGAFPGEPDFELRREVESLLASHEKDGALLEVPALEVAARMLANSLTHPRKDHRSACLPAWTCRNGNWRGIQDKRCPYGGEYDHSSCPVVDVTSTCAVRAGSAIRPGLLGFDFFSRCRGASICAWAITGRAFR